jgi:hypothetical protein
MQCRFAIVILLYLAACESRVPQDPSIEVRGGFLYLRVDSTVSYSDLSVYLGYGSNCYHLPASLNPGDLSEGGTFVVQLRECSSWPLYSLHYSYLSWDRPPEFALLTLQTTDGINIEWFWDWTTGRGRLLQRRAGTNDGIMIDSLSIEPPDSLRELWTRGTLAFQNPSCGLPPWPEEDDIESTKNRERPLLQTDSSARLPLRRPPLCGFP